MKWSDRMVGFGVGTFEALARPGSKQAAARSNNFFLPQFQTALGTVVHTTPVVEALKASVPDARIIVAASGLAHQVWEGNPRLERLFSAPSPLKDFPGAVRTLRAANLFDGKPYTTLLSVGNERTKVTLASLFAGPSRRVGYAVQPGLVDVTLQWDHALSQIQNNLRLLPASGIVVDPGVPSEPKIYPKAAENVAAFLPRKTGGLRIALATQTSVTQYKKWREERWLELFLKLRERYAAELVFIGTESEAPAIDALRERVPFDTMSLAGRTSIPQLAAVLQQCDLGIMLDTGPLHVGRAVQLPIVVIAPGWSPEHEWLPVGNPDYRILKKSDFLPPVPEDYIIDEVSVEDVLQAAAELVSFRTATSS